MEQNKIELVWPEWHIVKQLGQGSYGVVYEVMRKEYSLESHAAVKVITIPQSITEIDSIRSEGASLEETKTYFEKMVQEFVHEIQIMESLKGMPNIVGVEDYKVIEKTDSIGWDIYIRMELLNPLTRYTSDKILTQDEVIKLGIDVCTALETCEKLHIIHRDIKPENIFVNAFGDYKLGDFGIARKLEGMNESLSQKGTYNYMPPEVESGKHYNHTADIYSLGLVMYRFLNENRLPFCDTKKQLLTFYERNEALRRRLHGEKLPPPCNASEELASIVLCACEFNPASRFMSATAMKNALLMLLGRNNNKEDSEAEVICVKSDFETGKNIHEKKTKDVKADNIPKKDKIKIKTFGRKSVKKKIQKMMVGIILATLFLLSGTIVIKKSDKILVNNKSVVDSWNFFDIFSLENKIEEQYVGSDISAYSHSYSYSVYNGVDSFTIGSDSYEYGFTLGSKEAEYVNFDLKGEYKTIYGMIGIVDGDKDDAVIDIIGDGTVLSTIRVYGADLPKIFQVNVENINKLEIVSKGKEFYDTCAIGFGNVKAQKK